MPKEKKREETGAMKREFLKMKSSLIDKNTELPSFLMLFDDIRSFLSRRRQIGIIHVETSNLAMVESLYGWQIFENIMKKVSTRLKRMKGKAFPATSLLSINGAYGDQFILFIPETAEREEISPEYLLDIMDKISACLAEELLEEEYVAMPAKLSFNVGCSILQESPFYRLQRLILRAVEEARDMPLQKEERKNATLVAELKRIIAEEDVSTVFQDILDLKSMEVVGYEAFTRGPKGTTFEKPGMMFAISHHSGLSTSLDRLCRKMALKNAERLPHGFKLFINLLPESLRDSDWLSGGLDELLWRSDIKLEDMVIELPEKFFIENSGELEEQIKALRQKGFSIAFDDIGTGYSSFQSITEAQPDYIKMDITLVRDIDKSLIKQDIMKSLVQIAKRIGASVMAEGVETEKELDAIKKAGVQYAQGFFFSYPAMALPDSGKMVSRKY